MHVKALALAILLTLTALAQEPTTVALGDDLTPLKQRIGNARLVLLGEQTHRDGTTFEAKVRLGQFLHQQMGFDVLAGEAGFYDCSRMEAALHSSLPVGLFSVFAKSQQIRPVFDYARSTHSTLQPLEMCGFDCQDSGADAFLHLREELERRPQLLGKWQQDYLQFLAEEMAIHKLPAEEQSRRWDSLPPLPGVAFQTDPAGDSPRDEAYYSRS